MDRRHLVVGAAGWWAASLRAQEEAPRPRIRISAATLHDALSARFPMRFGFAGLLQLQISAPRLLLLPARNKLGATLLAQASTYALAQAGAGEVDAVFALRYEPSDRTVRAHRPEILAVRWPDLPPETVQALQDMLPSVASQLGEIVLHQFTRADLALADTMGFEPQQLQVADDGLVVVFGPKPAR